MKTYQSVPIKREVQNNLFSNLNVKRTAASGLAGNNPIEYVNLLNKHFECSEIFLYDTNPIECNKHINKKDINDAYVTNIMDCDFCSSIATDGNKLINIFKRMNDLPGKKVLSFTFSLRLKGGLNRTLEYLNSNIFNQQLTIIERQSIISGKWGQPFIIEYKSISQFECTRIFNYKDTSSMLSGIIVWQ